MVLGQRRRRVRLSAQPLRNLIPNMITILALCAGMTGVRYGLDGRFELAVSLIVAAGVLDGLDGRSARMLNSTSKIGAELDSLADFLSFGVAPALLVYLWTLNDVRGVGWAVGMLYATCCALRLARFNSEVDLPDRPRWTYFFFTGIPAPAAAALALTPMMLSFVTGGWSRSWPLNAVVLVFVAVMMVSRVPTFSLKRVRVQPDMVLPTLLIASVVIAGPRRRHVADALGGRHRLRAQHPVQRRGGAALAAARAGGRDPAPAAKPSPAPATPAPAKPAADRVVSFEPRPGQRPG